MRIDVRPIIAPIVRGEPGPGGELAEPKIAQVLVSVVQDFLSLFASLEPAP